MNGFFALLFGGGFFDGGEEGIFDVLFLLFLGGFGEFDVEFVTGEFAG